MKKARALVTGTTHRLVREPWGGCVVEARDGKDALGVNRWKLVDCQCADAKRAIRNFADALHLRAKRARAARRRA